MPVFNDPSRTILYLHVPKTAGVALRETIGSRFVRDKVLLAAELRANTGRPWERFAFISGHIGHPMDRREELPRVIVSLRDPVERVVSYVEYIRSDRVAHDHHPPWAAGANDRFRETQHLLRTCALPEFLERHLHMGEPYFCNLQTKMLAGAGEANLQRALDNLERCAAIAIAERFEESLRLIEHALGWLLPAPVRRMNAAPQRDRNIDDATRAAILAVNELDTALYARATDLFDEYIAMLRPPEARAQARYAERLSDPGAFSLEDMPDGSVAGFYVGERIDGVAAAWTGQQPCAIDVGPLPAGPLRADIAVVHTLDPRALEHVAVTINGENAVVKVTRKGHRRTLRATTQGRTSWPWPWTRLTLRTPRTVRPCDVDSRFADARPLGIAVAGASVSSDR